MPAFPDAERDSHMGLAGWARKVTGKPTMTVGGVGFSKDLQSSFVEETNAINNLPEVVERFERDEFDLVAVGRALLMDAEWVMKARNGTPFRSEEHTSELQSLMRISYAVFCLKQKTTEHHTLIR